MTIEFLRRAALVAAATLAPTAAVAQPAARANNWSTPRVEKLLAQMTLEEKIALIHGAPENAATSRGQAGFWPGLARLGIPSLRLVDGPPGVSDKDESTGMPATMALAATFSREEARQNGVVIGRDARALGQDVVLEPFINLVRDFGFTRAYNTFGEDPLLTGQLGAALITGVQSQGVMAQAKHFIAYDGGNDDVVDPQTLREIYMAPFADAAAADVSSVMCSYNKINGPYACGSGDAQNTMLRKEAGFRGFITSDWGAVHGTLFVNEGLDLEMPGAAESAVAGGGGMRSFFLSRVSTPPAGAPRTPGGGPNGALAGFGGAGGFGAVGVPPEERAPNAARGAGGARGGGGPGRGAGDPAPLGMLAAVQSGQVNEATITEAVRRILGAMDKFGFLDRAPKHDVTPQDRAFDAAVIRRTAERAAVLLKNEGGVLPLATREIAEVAFIGPGAGQTVAIGLPGEKSLGLPALQVGPVAAIEKLAGRRVVYAPANDMTGVPVPAAALSHDGAAGLLRTDTKTGATQTDVQLDFTQRSGAPLAGGGSYAWSGTLTVPRDGAYTIALQILGAGGTVTIDSQPVTRVSGVGRGGAYVHPVQDNVLPTTDNLDNARAVVTLTAGAHRLSVTATGVAPGVPMQVRLAWVSPEQRRANYDAALAAAKRATKAVVFAWGRDRPDVFALPGDQDQLIADIAAVNPNTVVVLNTSLPVAMPWLDRVKGVVQMWWPGDEGGPATANVLLGRTSPAGRLPVTWPKRLDQMVANDPAHPERSNTGVDGKTTYSEGIFMGYRHFDNAKLEPLFPFGYGLSYTTFAYSGLVVRPASDGGFDVTLRVRNTGTRDGDEVPQVYLGPPKPAPASAQFAVRSLAAFDRVAVPAGQTKAVTLHVAPRRLEYWSAAAGTWKRAAGPRTVFVGASSRDLRLQAETTIPTR